MSPLDTWMSWFVMPPLIKRTSPTEIPKASCLLNDVLAEAPVLRNVTSSRVLGDYGKRIIEVTTGLPSLVSKCVNCLNFTKAGTAWLLGCATDCQALGCGPSLRPSKAFSAYEVQLLSDHFTRLIRSRKDEPISTRANASNIVMHDKGEFSVYVKRAVHAISTCSTE